MKPTEPTGNRDREQEVIVVTEFTRQEEVLMIAEISCEEEEDERINFETLEHCTRDDVHEQREARQEYEGVIHAPPYTCRSREPHGFDGTVLPRASAPSADATRRVLPMKF